jgi:antitoxin ParD1/3/4
MRNDLRIVTMNVSLPGALKRFVDERVATGVYGSASEFIREAIREKMERDRERNRGGAAGASGSMSLAAQLIEGLDSGKPISFDDDYVKRKRRALLERRSKSKKSA